MNALIPLRPRGCPPRIDPRRWHQVLEVRIEWHLVCIDRLIAAMNAMDVDPDLEEAGDEQDQSFPEGWRAVGDSNFEDDEQDYDDEDADPREDAGDREPSLGAPERGEYSSQVAWAAGSDSDLEGTDNALGGDPDAEPIMGWSNPGAPGDGPLPDGWGNALSGAGCDND